MRIPMFLLAAALAATAAARAQDRGPDRAPARGEVAPVFTAKVLGKDEAVCLSTVVAREKKPVVLIFGSYT